MELLEGAAGSSAIVPAEAVDPAPVSTLTTTTGHINFFEDLERTTITVHGRSTRGKRSEPAESEKGFALAPSAKDLNPWYTDDKRRAKDERQEETDEEKRRRDLQRKSAHDPLTAINSQLASRSSSGPSSTSSYSGGRGRGREGGRGLPRPSNVSGGSASSTVQGQPSPESARLTRESSERQRALALIARKKREAAGSETPSTVHGGDAVGRYGGYGDVFNRREVEEVRRERHSRGWERDRDRDRGRDRRYGGRW
ncbi:hypothetical protein BD413DRAFT_31741 [Trametes elegans]|nr:hypothetical protein BD413DRAFT_31741 [Trametes elegans]